MESIKLKPRSKRERALYEQAKNEGFIDASAQLSAEKRRHEESCVKLAKDTSLLHAVPQLAKALYEICIAAGVAPYAGRR